MDVAGRLKPSHLEIRKRYSPRILLDQLAATAAPSPTAGGALGAVDPGQALVSDTPLGDRFQAVCIGNFVVRPFQDLEQHRGAFECAAERVKPDGHFPFPEGVGFALSEPELALGDGLLAAAALRAAAHGGFDDVAHQGLRMLQVLDRHSFI